MAARPPILYKYLDEAGAEAFLKQPQVRYTDFRRLDDLMEVLPGFRGLSDEEAAEQGKISHSQLPQISLKKHVFFQKTRSQVDPRYLEKEFRTLLANSWPTLFICSLTARPDSVAMWSQYAQRHEGIVFGLSTALDRLCVPPGPDLLPVIYSDVRLQIPFPHANADILKQTVRFKSTDWQHQSEWRLLSSSNATHMLTPTDIEEVIIGYRASAPILSLAKQLRASGVRIMHANPNPKHYRMEARELE